MKTCTICQEEVTRVQIREGAALTRGSDHYHRECHRSLRGASAPAPLPVRPAGGGGSVASVPPIPAAGGELAGFWRRLGAHVIDGFLVNIVVFFSSFVFGMGAGMIGGLEPSLISILGGVIGAVLPLAYCLWFWTKKGATPGKMALGLRVVGADNQPPTGAAAFIRYIGYIPSGLVLGLGYLWMIFDDQNRCWHDMMAGTRVIRV